MIDHRLRVLQAVESQGTVTGAAELLGYSPSAVSAQLRTLARDLGVAVLRAEGRGVQLTPAGRLLAARATELQVLWDQVRGELAEADEHGVRRLRLAGFSTAAAALLPATIAQVRERWPAAACRIIEADPLACFDLLSADAADVAVVVLTPSLPPSSDPRFEQRHLFDDPLDVLLPLDHALADRHCVELRALAEEEWILDRPGTPYHQLTLNACADAGFVPSVAHEAAEWDTGAALVSAGLGVALVPRLARLPGGADLVRVPLQGEPSPARHVLTAIRRGSGGSPEVAAALTALERVAREAVRDRPYQRRR